MNKPVLSSTRSPSRFDPSNSPPHQLVAGRINPSPKPLFAESPFKDPRLNANTAPYLPKSKTTNTHVQVQPVQVVEAATDEFTSYVNVKIGGLSTKVLFDSGCSKSLISIDQVHRIHAKLQPLEQSDSGFMIGISGAMMKCLGKIRVNVLLNDFPVNTEFFVLNNFTQQAILGLAFFHKTKALLNFDLGLICFYSGVIELPFVTQISFHSLAYTVSNVELPPFSESIIPVRIVNNGFKDKCVYVQGRFAGIIQLYAVGRSLSNIDADGLIIC